jgi:hypothetical protein
MKISRKSRREKGKRAKVKKELEEEKHLKRV